MRVILFGPPGAGKGTHARLLSEKWKVPHFAAGDILRAHIREGTAIGKRAKAIIERGELVPDELVNELMLSQLEKTEAKRGSILDGYPRTIGQAEALESFLKKRSEKLDAALYFKTSEEVIIERLSGRLACPQCGANYHVRNIPPRVQGRCDQCGSVLIQRKDDRQETIRHRLEVYEKETSPLLDYYRKRGSLREVSGDLDVPELQEELSRVFSAKGGPASGGEGVVKKYR
jgi:adenylate kinase